MAQWTYKAVQKLLMVSEGGYSNDAHDPGGVTLNGVIQSRYNEYRRAKGLPQKALTRGMLGNPEWENERDEIYFKYYALPVAYNEQPAGVDYTVYDYGVNSGPGRAGKVLRRVLGLPTNTSTITQEVMDAVKKRDPDALIDAINNERKAFLENLSTCQYFCKGWLPRVARVRKDSHGFAKGKGLPTVVVPVEPAAKATLPEPKAVKNVVKGAGPAVVAEEAARQPMSWIDWIVAHPVETGFAVVVAVVVVSLAIHFINKWHKNRAEEPMPGTPVVPETKYTKGA